jgi:hypothetical protein
MMVDGSGAPLRAFVTAALVLAGAPLSAQTLEGTLVSEPDGTPLGGAHLVLLDDTGAEVASTLTDGTGHFTMEAPAPGGYTVRGEHVGYRTAEVSVEETSNFSTKLDDSCEVPLETAQGVAALWEEVAKAFRAVTHVQDEGLLRFEVARWYRQLDPRRLRTQDENRQVAEGFHPGSPMVTPSPDVLSQGYIQGGEGQGYSFYAPDVRTLLSDSFRTKHCFGFEDSGPEDGWLGLAFRPRNREAMDIEGTLWIDGATYEPRRLDFRYSSLPWPLRTDKVGGRLEFQRVHDGAWIVSRWWIRMPRVNVRTTRITQWDPPKPRYTLAAVVEEGGEVVRVSGPDHAIIEIR